MSILRIDHALGHVLAAEHLFLDFLNVPFLVEVMHLLAELANRIVVIAILVVLVEARKYVFQRRIFVEILFKAGNLTHKVIHFLLVLCRRHEEKNGVKVIFFRNDAVFSQVVRKDGGWHTEVFVFTGFNIDTRCCQHEFARINKVLVLTVAFEGVPFFAWNKFKKFQILSNKIRRVGLPVSASNFVRNKRLNVVAGIQQQLACVDSGLDAVGPKSASGFSFLHFGVERQTADRRGSWTRAS